MTDPTHNEELLRKQEDAKRARELLTKIFTERPAATRVIIERPPIDLPMVLGQVFGRYLSLYAAMRLMRRLLDVDTKTAWRWVWVIQLLQIPDQTFQLWTAKPRGK